MQANELSTYEDLADPKWKGRVCVRSSSSIYNQSLLASLIAAKGAAQAEQWAQGLVANLAKPPTPTVNILPSVALQPARNCKTGVTSKAMR